MSENGLKNSSLVLLAIDEQDFVLLTELSISNLKFKVSLWGYKSLSLSDTWNRQLTNNRTANMTFGNSTAVLWSRIPRKVNDLFENYKESNYNRHILQNGVFISNLRRPFAPIGCH